MCALVIYISDISEIYKYIYIYIYIYIQCTPLTSTATYIDNSATSTFRDIFVGFTPIYM